MKRPREQVLPHLLPYLRDVTLIPPSSVSAAAQALDAIGPLKSPQDEANEIAADSGTGLFQVGHAERTGEGSNCGFNQCCLGAAGAPHLSRTFLEQAIGVEE